MQWRLPSNFVARTNLLALAMLVATSAAFTCAGGDTSSSGSTSTSSSSGTGGGLPSMGTLRIDPPTDSAVIILGQVPASIPFHAYLTVGANPEVDVTSSVSWTIDSTFATVDSSGAMKPLGIGGTRMLGASLEGASASATVTLELTGDVYGPGTDPSTKGSFTGASPDSNPADAPAIEYPEDQTILPANLPPVDGQWSQAADNAVYQVELTSPNVLDVSFYTTGRDLTFDAATWALLGQSTYDAPITMVVRGLGGGQVRSSTPRTLTISADRIDESAIYVWQSSSGSFRVLNLDKGTDVALPNDSPALAQGQPCSGCHRVSRDGKRFSYTFNGGLFQFGTLAYDAASQSFKSKILPSAAFRATYATFNPLESAQIPAMLTSLPDDVPQNTAGTVRLGLFDPDTNTPVMSDLPAALAQIDSTVGHATLMPDWSPDGSFVVFAAYDSDQNFVRDLGDDIVHASIVEVPVSYDGASKTFHFGAPKTLVHAAAGNDPDTAENNFLPTISPDGGAVAFTRAAGWWSIKTQQTLINLSGQIAVVRRSDGTVIELVRGSNGPGTTASSTWPQWAPTVGNRYMWLAYGGERPYGHLLTSASPENAQCGLVQGQKQCKHLWVTAIDRQKLASGTEDPSSPPFWIPGQTIAAQYVSPQWTSAVAIPQ